MSSTMDLFIEIQECLEKGDSPYIVAKRLAIPVEWVFEVEDDLNGEVTS